MHYLLLGLIAATVAVLLLRVGHRGWRATFIDAGLSTLTIVVFVAALIAIAIWRGSP